MARAKYTHIVTTTQGRNCIIIEDVGSGSMLSVTNDIENVVKEIGIHEGIDPNKHMIIYRDSEGTWDGWDNERERFVSLNCRTSAEAISTYIMKLTHSPV